MNAWRPAALWLAAGLAAGAAGGLWLGRRAGPEPRERYTRMVERFSSQLDLTEAQRSQVKAILEAKRGRVQALRAQLQPRFQEIRESTRAELRRVLTPDQQARFDRFEAEWRARRDAERGREGAP